MKSTDDFTDNTTFQVTMIKYQHKNYGGRTQFAPTTKSSGRKSAGGRNYSWYHLGLSDFCPTSGPAFTNLFYNGNSRASLLRFSGSPLRDVFTQRSLCPHTKRALSEKSCSCYFFSSTHLPYTYTLSHLQQLVKSIQHKKERSNDRPFNSIIRMRYDIHRMIQHQPYPLFPPDKYKLKTHNPYIPLP